MLALKSLIVAGMFAVAIHPAMAANDGGQRDIPSRPAGSLEMNQAHATTAGVNGAPCDCEKPKPTLEQRAERRARAERHLALGIPPKVKSPEQKASAAARRAARCNTTQSRY